MNSRSAIDMFNDDMVFKPYKLNDFACKCGCGTTLRDNYFVEYMNFLFFKTNKMFTITSGVRCDKHNAKVGGKPNSDHCNCLAIDVSTPTIEDRGFVSFYASVYGIKRQIIYIDKKFIHLSINYSEKMTKPMIVMNLKGMIY